MTYKNSVIKHGIINIASFSNFQAQFTPQAELYCVHFIKEDPNKIWKLVPATGAPSVTSSWKSCCIIDCLLQQEHPFAWWNGLLFFSSSKFSIFIHLVRHNKKKALSQKYTSEITELSYLCSSSTLDMTGRNLSKWIYPAWSSSTCLNGTRLLSSGLLTTSWEFSNKTLHNIILQ